MNQQEAQDKCARAVALVTGGGAVADPAGAVALFTEVADAGFAEGQFGLAELKLTGNGTAFDDAGAVKLYEQAAAQGNVPALFRLAQISAADGPYHNGDKARSCLEKCAAAGFPPAFGALGDCFFYGRGTLPDPGKAAQWYAKAAKNGDFSSMYKLGCMLEGGMGLAADPELSQQMFLQAAYGGIAEAQFRVAALAYDDKIKGGRKAAAQWYSSCAEKIPVAKFNLATMYNNGDGVPADKEKAFKLYSEVATTGDADALFQVGKMYIDGDGVAQEPAKGFEFIGKAAQAGSDEAKVLIENLKRRQNTQFVRIDGT